MSREQDARGGGTLYAQVTDRIIAELEAGRLPWVQPWDGSELESGLPRNAGTGRRYSGINVLILWATVFERGFGTQGWLTYRQAQALGGNVRKGETGTTICYADRFTPKDRDQQPITEPGDEHRWQVAFLKRFTVFNVDQCEGLPEALSLGGHAFLDERETIACARGADRRDRCGYRHRRRCRVLHVLGGPHPAAPAAGVLRADQLLPHRLA